MLKMPFFVYYSVFVSFFTCEIHSFINQITADIYAPAASMMISLYDPEYAVHACPNDSKTEAVATNPRTTSV